MKLKDILKNVDVIGIRGSEDIEIKNIKYNSKNVEKGDIFAAIKGESLDGHNFIDDAIARGASAVIHQNNRIIPQVTDIVVSDSRKALALISDKFYGSPSKNLKLIGITGTNGKTTVSYLVKNIIEASGLKTGLLGTISYRIEEECIDATLTTPESLEIHSFFDRIKKKKANYAVLEVSSHALKQNRIYGLKFTSAVFTNISRDHLDYHQNMEDYINSKLKLFNQLDDKNSFAVINIDDPISEKIIKGINAEYFGYSISKKSDIYPIYYNLNFDGILINAYTPKGDIKIDSRLIGYFNIYNILAAVGVGIGLNIDKNIIKEGIENVEQIPGRIEKLKIGQKFDVIIDYSHTPDSLLNVISTVKKLTKRDVIAVFGCGGDRDKGKRPLMGRIASDNADIVIITSDNPRTENPQQIIVDIVKGIEKKENVILLPDRKEAIIKALSIAEEYDTVLILGKGHENYQIIGKDKIHFNDKEVALDFLKQM